MYFPILEYVQFQYKSRFPYNSRQVSNGFCFVKNLTASYGTGTV